jgi:DNA-binding PadR family transcriptional regulator
MGSPLDRLGRFARPAQQILNVLAAGPRVPIAMQRDVEARCGTTIGPGTLFGTIARLERYGLIEVVASAQAPQAYRLTALGAETLAAQLEAVRAASTAPAAPMTLDAEASR